MKRLLVLAIGFFIIQSIEAQNNYFILVENPAKSTFTIKTNSNIYEGTHFITIPKLSKGQHSLQFNIANAKPFTITINIDNEDLGLVLKQSIERGFSLFDMNSFKTIEADNVAKIVTEKPEIIVPVVKEDKPKDIVIPTPVATKEEKPTNVIIAPKKDEITISQITEKKPVVSTNGIRKIFENPTDKGLDQIFVVENKDKLDTVAIFIPTLQPPIKESLKIAEPAPKVEVIAKSDDKPIAFTNLTCTQLMTNNEIEVIKNEMEQQPTDKLKQKTVSRFFDKKCFTVAQMKLLGTVFMNDYYKFDFYRFSKKLIADTENYASLESSLSEEKVKEMFRDTINN